MGEGLKQSVTDEDIKYFKGIETVIDKYLFFIPNIGFDIIGRIGLMFHPTHDKEDEYFLEYITAVSKIVDCPIGKLYLVNFLDEILAGCTSIII